MQPPNQQNQQPQQPATTEPAWTVGAGSADIPEGTYPMILTGLGPIRRDVQTTYGMKDFRDWFFQIVGPGDFEDREVRGGTSTATGARSTAFRWLTVLLGREPQKGEEIPLSAISGRVVLGQIAHRDDWAKVVELFPLPDWMAAQVFSQMTGAPVQTAPATAQPTYSPAPAQQPQYAPPPANVIPQQPVPSAPVPQAPPQPAPAVPVAPPAPQQPGQFVMPAGQPQAAPPLREQVASGSGDLPF